MYDFDYLDDFVCDTTCEEYWTDWDNWEEPEEDYFDVPSAPSYGIPDSYATYAMVSYSYDWSDWDI